MSELAREQLATPRLERGTPLTGAIEYLNGLTRDRNERELPTLLRRVAHLQEGVSQLEGAVRSGDLKSIPPQAAKIALQIFTVLQETGSTEEFVAALMRKYPEAGCRYCSSKPCMCGKNRRQEIAGANASEVQKVWTVRDWQKNLAAVYGPVNVKRGMEFAVLRLVREAGEANAAMLRIDNGASSADQEKQKQVVIAELADSFAWVAGVVNVLAPKGPFGGPNFKKAPQLEDFIIDEYGDGCRVCGKYPCECGAFSYREDDKR